MRVSERETEVESESESESERKYANMLPISHVSIVCMYYTTEPRTTHINKQHTQLTHSLTHRMTKRKTKRTYYTKLLDYMQFSCSSLMKSLGTEYRREKGKLRNFLHVSLPFHSIFHQEKCECEFRLVLVLGRHDTYGLSL